MTRALIAGSHQKARLDYSSCARVAALRLSAQINKQSNDARLILRLCERRVGAFVPRTALDLPRRKPRAKQATLECQIARRKQANSEINSAAFVNFLRFDAIFLALLCFCACRLLWCAVAMRRLQLATSETSFARANFACRFNRNSNLVRCAKLERLLLCLQPHKAAMRADSFSPPKINKTSHSKSAQMQAKQRKAETQETRKQRALFA